MKIRFLSFFADEDLKGSKQIELKERAELPSRWGFQLVEHEGWLISSFPVEALSKRPLMRSQEDFEGMSLIFGLHYAIEPPQALE